MIHSKLRSKISLLTNDDEISTNSINCRSRQLTANIVGAYVGRPSSAPSTGSDQKIITWKSKNLLKLQQEQENHAEIIIGKTTNLITRRNVRSASHHQHRDSLPSPGINQQQGFRPKSGYTWKKQFQFQFHWTTISNEFNLTFKYSKKWYRCHLKNEKHGTWFWK